MINKDWNTVSQVLIQQQGQGKEEATWENEFSMKSQFPDFRLGEKSPPDEARIDRTGSASLDLNGRPKTWYFRSERESVWGEQILLCAGTPLYGRSSLFP